MKRKLIYLCSVVFLLLLSGCSTKTYFNKPGASQADFDSDYYQCYRESLGYESSSQLISNSLGTTATSTSGRASDTKLLHMCMRSKGYAVSKSKPSSADYAEANRNRMKNRKELPSSPLVNEGRSKSGKLVCKYKSGKTKIFSESTNSCPAYY